MSVSFTVPDAARGEGTTFVEDITRAMMATVGAILDDDGLTSPDLHLTFADDVMAASAAAGKRLGLPPDHRVGAERVGGVVGGKCLVSDDGEQAAIIVAADAANPTDAYAQVCVTEMIAHELGHLVYGAVRKADIGTFPNVWLPWDIAGVITVVAAEEWRVDMFALVLAEAMLKLVDDTGNPVAPVALTGPQWTGDSLVGALNELSPSVESSIWEYRNHRLDLETMWEVTARASEGVTLFIAHADAHHPGPGLILEGLDHRGARLLEPVWRPLLAYLRGSSRLPASGEWAEDRTQLVELGRTGLSQVWRRLGLTARPEGDTFHLAVTDPAENDIW